MAEAGGAAAVAARGSRWPRMVAMARPVVVVVDAEDSSRQALTRELEGRYGADYRIVSNGLPEEALAGPEQLRGEGADVPLVLTRTRGCRPGQARFLARVRELYPTARRALLISWGGPSVPAPIVEAAALGQIDFYLPKPVWSPDQQFHLAITESLAEWWRQQGGQFAAVTVIGAEPSARVHEIRDLLTRNSVPFGFQRADSEEGSAALQRLGLDQASGPVVTLYTGVVLADRANAQVAEALRVVSRPAETTYNVVVVGGWRGGPGRRSVRDLADFARRCWSGRLSAARPGTSSLIRNFFGFPRGISCAELAGRAYEQTWTFGTQFVYGNPATSLATDGDLRVVGLQDGSAVTQPRRCHRDRRFLPTARNTPTGIAGRRRRVLRSRDDKGPGAGRQTGIRGRWR